MNRLSVRVWLTAALLAVGWLSTFFVRSGYTFEVRPLTQSLNNFPIELEGYRGTDIPLDEGVREILNADAVMNRHYQRPDGQSMMAHVSVWLRPESVSSVAPHVPKICYVNSGYQILEERLLQISTPAGKIPVNLLLLERGSERSVAAYWYQMGRSTFTTPSEARQIHRGLWGQKNWPATIKVLLQTPSPSRDIDSALPRIEEFASIVFPWTNQL